MHHGYLALVLHAHLPYVRHGDRDDCLEERWIYEAMLESYLPILLVCEKLLEDRIDFRLTVAVSPTLLSMLEDELVQSRFRIHLRKTVELAGREVRRSVEHPKEHRLAKMYLERFREIVTYCTKHQYSLIPALKKLQDSGCVEVITCAATHAFLPYVETEEAIRAQLLTGIETHTRILGKRPTGIWLPECGYTLGLDRLLKEAGIRYFFVDSHTIQHATPHPRRGLYAPLLTPYDVAAFARDEVASRQVWSSYDGYPGDFDYREYYRDIGFDREMTYIEPYIHPAGIRVHTGLKYHRITGKNVEKDWYDPQLAREKAEAHAQHFLEHRERQVRETAVWMDREPLVVATYDAELFGHWWYEGPQFLDHLLRKTAMASDEVRLITPAAYLERYPENDRARLPMSSWGRNGYGEVWLNERNDWLYRHLHQAEREMVEAVIQVQRQQDLGEKAEFGVRCLRQAARELMLAQSSDWSFIMDGQTVVEYAVRRVHDHLTRFFELIEMVRSDQYEPVKIQSMEMAYPLFPDVRERYYLPASMHKVNVSQQMVAVSQAHGTQPRILMLSWEFPPYVVGGLGRAVYDLAIHLVRLGVEVHVLTGSADRVAGSEWVEGIHVHRVNTFSTAEQEDFLQWVFQLNLAIVDTVEQMRREGFYPDLIHAHDWLVGWAAVEMKHRWNLPLISTIHALEHGRHQGIHSPLQQRIHDCERELCKVSDRIFVCSQYMMEEVKRLFGMAEEKMCLIYNGVESPPDLTEEMSRHMEEVRRELGLGQGPMLFFVGRLVKEKGVHLLLQAVSRLRHEHPDLTLVIAGKGPMREELQDLAHRYGIASEVRFLGFVEDERRNVLFRLADVAVFPSLYEPFGIVALEAMSFGTPLLAADTGGLREIVRHQENGVTMYAGDVDSLVNQLRWLLNHPEERIFMSKVAQSEVQSRYAWTHLAQKTVEQYRMLLPAVRPDEEVDLVSSKVP
ncbi:1,4-alpha-glucan branching protein domain-containing protein [Brevibacillus invocatus]|uniref:1,4-alpha-glucan branching protein domain-containing protein n=1 Tax=Brevibacillus invocatus TaxID=173959 RepID=UPI00204199D7|nr:DUF1957 domain-containing protein [Brevibacillus invocatus]MCM3431581.1 DUF1957 domain-containing protein [Brevibacillus invocatus]